MRIAAVIGGGLEPSSSFVIDLRRARARPLPDGSDFELWAPDGRAMLVDRDGSLWIFSPDGREDHRVTEGDNILFGVEWSTDGREILFVGDLGSDIVGENTQLYIVNVQGTQRRRLTNLSSDEEMDDFDWQASR
jgi:dipeptidyl aminopeptidase/acylaminoacyl peptidase